MTTLSNNGIKILRNMLINDEGIVLHPYEDTVGKITIGIGRNLSDRGLSLDESMYLLENDMSDAEKACLTAIGNWQALTENRKIVLINMMFNLGLPKFLTFKNMIAAILKQDHTEVVKQMLTSKWHDDVGARADRLAKLWLEG